MQLFLGAPFFVGAPTPSDPPEKAFGPIKNLSTRTNKKRENDKASPLPAPQQGGRFTPWGIFCFQCLFDVFD